MLPRLLLEQRIRVFAINTDDGIKGIQICLTGPKMLGMWNGGFDDSIKHWSPGMLLVAKQLEVCHDEHIAEYDFMRGDEGYKSRWATGSRDIVTLTLCN